MNKLHQSILTLLGASLLAVAANAAVADDNTQGPDKYYGQRQEAAKARHERWQQMSPEQREAKRNQMRERWQNMSPEQRATWKNRDPGVNRRQFNQHERIEQGVRSGALTKEEAKGLGAEQRAIRQEERDYKADGKLTKDERKDLQQDLNTASKDIYQEKHDAERR